MRCAVMCVKMLQLDRRLLYQLGLVVLLEADLVQAQIVNCTRASDGQGCGEIV